jgi:hypothetical protein
MSLKSFHLLFIACASALAFLFGAWLLSAAQLAGAARVAAVAASFAVGLGLVAYEAWFLRYSRRER